MLLEGAQDRFRVCRWTPAFKADWWINFRILGPSFFPAALRIPKELAV